MKKWLCALVFPCLLLSACTQTAVDTHEVHIPIMGTATYFKADDSFLKGAEMAIQDANEVQTVYHFTSATYDDGDNYEMGMAIADTLFRDSQAPAIIGTQNFTILNSAAEYAKKAEKIMVMPHGSEENVRQSGNPFLFANTFSAADIGCGMEQYLSQTRFKNIVVCYDESDLAHTMASSLARTENLEIVDYIRGDISEEKFDLVYQRWEDLGVEAVAIMHNTDVAYHLARMIRERNPNMAIIGDYGFDIPSEIEAMGSLGNGIVMSFIFPIQPTQKLEAFQTRYEAKYGSGSYTLWAAHGYDSVKMITDTIIQEQSTDAKLIAEVLHRDGYHGLTHTIQFDANGAMIPDEPLYQIAQNGKFYVILEGSGIS